MISAPLCLHPLTVYCQNGHVSSYFSHLEIGSWSARDNLDFKPKSADLEVGIIEVFKEQDI